MIGHRTSTGFREPGVILAHGNSCSDFQSFSHCRYRTIDTWFLAWFPFQDSNTGAKIQPFVMQILANANLCFRQQFEGTELSGRCPMSHFWDESEPRLFVCETVPISSEASSNRFLDMASTVVHFTVFDSSS